MLRLLTRSRRPARPAARRPARPCLEWLEARDCPSYVGLNVSYGAGKQITLYGSVLAGAFSSSPTPGMGGQLDFGGSMAGLTVAFSGSASGSAVTDGNGNFSYTTNATSLGEVDAATTDRLSNIAKVVLSSSAPVISGFGATEQGNTNFWNIIGHVTDGNFSAAGLVVHINGSPVTIYNNGQGLSGAVDSNGNFNICVRLNGASSDNGNIDASVTDAWGMESNNPIFDLIQPNT